jgi:hypothetical protein
MMSWNVNQVISKFSESIFCGYVNHVSKHRSQNDLSYIKRGIRKRIAHQLPGG